MKHLLIAPLVSLAALSVVSCEQIDEQDLGDTPAMAHERPVMEGIIGGTPTQFKDWQGVIAVHAGGMWGGLCSGTLIHPQVVLTAGHCVELVEYGYDYSKNPGQVTITKGASAYPGTQIGRGAQIMAHPSWKGELSDDAGDVALIKLAKPVEGVPIYKVRDFPLPNDDDAGKLVGYGGTGGGAGTGVHRQGDTTLLHVLSRVIETGIPANTCQGDSGGPLFTQQNGEWVVTGVTSFGMGDCVTDNGSYSTNVLAYCDWLNEAMIELVGEDLGLEGCKACTAKSFDGQWGQACGAGYPCCPEGTKCSYPIEFTDGDVGMCAPECCDLGSEDASRCPGISDGAPSCAFVNDDGTKLCGIACKYDKDCPAGTECVRNSVTQSVEGKYCMTVAKGQSDEVCEEEVGEGEGEGEGGEGEGEGEGGEGEGEGEGGGEGEAEVLDDAAGCGCAAAGSTSRILSLLSVFFGALLG